MRRKKGISLLPDVSDAHHRGALLNRMPYESSSYVCRTPEHRMQWSLVQGKVKEKQQSQMPALLAVSRDTQAANTDGFRLLEKQSLTMMSGVGGEEIRRQRGYIPRQAWPLFHAAGLANQVSNSVGAGSRRSPAHSIVHLPNINFMVHKVPHVSIRSFQM